MITDTANGCLIIFLIIHDKFRQLLKQKHSSLKISLKWLDTHVSDD